MVQGGAVGVPEQHPWGTQGAGVAQLLPQHIFSLGCPRTLAEHDTDHHHQLMDMKINHVQKPRLFRKAQQS